MTVTETVATRKDHVHDFLDPDIISEALSLRRLNPDWYVSQLLDLLDQAKAEGDYKGAGSLLRQLHTFIVSSARTAVIKRTLSASGTDPGAIADAASRSDDPAVRLLGLTSHRRTLPDAALPYQPIRYEQGHQQGAPLSFDVTIDHLPDTPPLPD